MRDRAAGTSLDGFQANGLEDAFQGEIIDLVDIIPGSGADGGDAPLTLRDEAAALPGSRMPDLNKRDNVPGNAAEKGAPSLNLADDEPLVLTRRADPLPGEAGGLRLDVPETPGAMPDLAESAPLRDKPVDLLHLADPLPEEEPRVPSPASLDGGALRIDDEPLPKAPSPQLVSPQETMPQALSPQAAEMPSAAREEMTRQAEDVPARAAEAPQAVKLDSRLDALEERLTLLEVRMEARLNAFASSLDAALAETRAALDEMKKRQDALYSEEGAQDFFVRMQPDIERAAARSAAQALREELSQLLELHKAAPKKPF